MHLTRHPFPTIGEPMKTMLFADLIIMGNHFKDNAVFAAIMFLIPAFLTAGSPMILLYVAPIWVTMALQIIMLEEGKGGWERFRLTLPLSRNQVVAGRYASIGFVAVVSTVIAIVLCLAIGALLAAFPAIQQFVFWKEPFNPIAFVLYFSLSIAATLFLTGAVMPLITRFGVAGAMRYTPGIIIVIAMLALYALSSAGFLKHGNILLSLTSSDALLFSFGIFALGIMWYAASAALSAKLYAGRDF